MESSVLVEVELPYRATISDKGKRAVRETFMRTRATVAVRKVAATDAPKVIEARWPGGKVPLEMHWRYFGDALWRPLVGQDGAAMDAAGGFERALADIGDRRDPYAFPRTTFQWPDYPFRTRHEERYISDLPPFDLDHERDATVTVRSSDPEPAIAAAQAKAADDMIVVDGVLHVRTAPPVWAVGCRSEISKRAGQVRLAIPDFPPHAGWLASFPLDRRDVAMAFSGRLVETANEKWPLGISVIPDGAMASYDDIPFPDTRAQDLRDFMDGVEDEIGFERLRGFSRAFRKAFGDLGHEIDALPRAAAEPGQLAGAVSAVRSLAETVRGEWAEAGSWKYALVLKLDALTTRDDVEAGIAMAADAEAFAGPNM